VSLTGDPITDAVIPAAVRLIWAVRESDAAEVDQSVTDAVNAVGWAGIQALVVVLAAMVPDDLPPSDLLAWMADPEEYLRLRTAGVDSLAAATLARSRAEEEVA
jgi:hypothetical protein